MVEPTGAIHIGGGDFSDYRNFSCLDPGVSVCRSFGLEEAIRRSRLSAAGVIEITSMCRLEYDHDHTTGRRFGA